MITTTKLKMRTVKDLAEMARKKGVSGWHSMRKDQLIKALLKQAKSDGPSVAKRAKANGNGKAATAMLVHSNGHGNGDAACKAKATRIRNRLRQIKERLSQFKDLAFRSNLNGNGPVRDRLVVMVRDPYWLHAYWESTGPASSGQRWPWANIGMAPARYCGSTRLRPTVPPPALAAWCGKLTYMAA